jgi:hypothetical protein
VSGQYLLDHLHALAADFTLAHENWLNHAKAWKAFNKKAWDTEASWWEKVSSVTLWVHSNPRNLNISFGLGSGKVWEVSDAVDYLRIAYWVRLLSPLDLFVV